MGKRSTLTPTGFLLVDKPAGMSSHRAVAAVRRELGYVRAGHAGTLDPFATGLLVVATGAATRLLSFAQTGQKRYDLVVRLGAVSDTDDVTGEVIETEVPVPDEPTVRAAVATVAARTRQAPPSVSAIHIDGERAYRRVRRGEEVEVAERDVRMWDLQIHRVDTTRGLVDLSVSCSSGTYMRALARDIGAELGCGGCAQQLRRTSVAGWSVEDALAPSNVSTASVRPPAGLVTSLPQVEVDAAQHADVLHGRAIVPDAPSLADADHAAILHGGELVAVASVVDGDGQRTLQPRIVLATAEASTA